MITAAVITSTYPLKKSFLDSLNFADEIIVVVDTPTRHREQSVAIQKSKIKYYFQPLNNNFAAQRNFALSKAVSDWVFFIDDDEYVGKELSDEIMQAIKNNEIAGYYLKRRDVVFHQLLLHGETGEIKILRLARKNAGKFIRPVHEFWKVKGRVGELNNPLYHIKDHFVSGFMGRISNYGKIDSESLSSEGKPFSYFRLLVNPAAKFSLNYFLKAGFMDGYAGLFQSYLMAVQSLSVRVFQWENRR